MYPPRIQRIDQCPDYMLLTGQFGETLGTPLAGEDEITHVWRQTRMLQQLTLHEQEGGGPRQLLFGTRHHRYRCSLPGLAEFTANRREETNASHHKPGGEGEIRTREGREAPPVFKTGAFNRSATSPDMGKQATNGPVRGRALYTYPWLEDCLT
jgi:hypothetical protein